MHPLSRPVRLIIGLCVVILGLNVFVLWWLQTLAPTFPFASPPGRPRPIVSGGGSMRTNSRRKRGRDRGTGRNDRTTGGGS